MGYSIARLHETVYFSGTPVQIVHEMMRRSFERFPDMRTYMRSVSDRLGGKVRYDSAQQFLEDLKELGYANEEGDKYFLPII